MASPVNKNGELYRGGSPIIHYGLNSSPCSSSRIKNVVHKNHVLILY